MRALLSFLKDLAIHKMRVFANCCALGIPWRGIMHDLSKLRPSEAFGLVQLYRADGNKNLVDLAHLAHIHRNPHHWEWWILLTEKGVQICEMPDNYRREMLADWLSKPNVYSWYLANASGIILHPVTRVWVEYTLAAYAQRNHD